MNLIRNLLALIGLVAVVGAGVGYVKSQDALAQFDTDAGQVYMELVQNILKTHNAAEATIWKMKVADGLSPEDVEQTMKFVANEFNISNVGELPLYKDVEAKSGEKYRSGRSICSLIH